MEPPDSFQAAAVRTEKLKVWRSIEGIRCRRHGTRTVRSRQSRRTEDAIGYRQEERVNPESHTETFGCRSSSTSRTGVGPGVPFYLRAGKRLGNRVTEVSVVFKNPPTHLFKTNASDDKIEPNVISIRIQPDEGISLRFGAKVPGPTTNVAQVDMNFSYAEAFGKSSANGYERLASGRDARRRHPVCPSRRRRGHLGAVYPDPRSLGCGSGTSISLTTPPEPGDRRLRTSCSKPMAAPGANFNPLLFVIPEGNLLCLSPFCVLHPSRSPAPSIAVSRDAWERRDQSPPSRLVHRLAWSTASLGRPSRLVHRLA